MKKSIGYYLLMAFTWPMQLFPLEFHYIFADILYFIVYHLAGYRKSTVSLNLRNSFPNKSSDELKAIERRFYHHFTDMFIETLYLTHISQKKHAKRLSFENMELIDRLYEEGRNIICVAGHYGNWEFSRLFSVKIKHKLYAIYKKLNSRVFDKFYKDLRGKDGATLLEMKETYKQLVDDAKNGIPYFAVLIADQRPIKQEIQYWMTFLNQETPVLLGPEKIAKKTNAAVVMGEVLRIKRGYYKLVFTEIAEHPQQTKEYEITNKFMHQLESTIKQCPELWLWSHKRWKHKKEN